MFVGLIVSVGAMCGISTVLALIMVAAESTIGNYGDVKISINDGEKEIDARGGKPLLTTLKEGKVFIPSACGGRGSCGLCKCKVKGGAGEVLPTELPWLNAEERKTNVRLSCQLKVKTDMQVEIDPELLYVREFKTEVVGWKKLTHDIVELQLKLLEPDAMEYKAGQFVQIETPEYDLTDEPVYRAYSMSSVPSMHNVIEMEVRLVPDGICTTYVHNHLKMGDSMTVNGPYGDFHLSNTDKEMICIAGGSGMAPLKSILYDMREKGSTRKATYFFGAKSKRDLFLVDEMKQLETDLPAFQFIPALSEPQDEDDWQGETGLITEVVDRHTGDLSNAEGYLCGSPFMIDACITVLKNHGMPEENIFYDKFS
ncbi:MAG: NADH:ubiquinone reductase (Na(+)-transporting) subunit F [Kiritimatiellia bacterium]